MLIKPDKIIFKFESLILDLQSRITTLWYVFWGKNNYNDIREYKSKLVIMQYKVIDTKSQHFGKVLDFKSCADVKDLGGVILKIDEETFSLFRFNEVEKIDTILAS